MPAIAEEDEEIEIGDGRFHYRVAGEVLHPEREPFAVLERLKVDMGSQAFSAQYQQAPIPADGALIQDDRFREYIRPPERRPEDRVVQSWDTGTKAGPTNDFSACTTWLIRGEIATDRNANGINAIE